MDNAAPFPPCAMPPADLHDAEVTKDDRVRGNGAVDADKRAAPVFAEIFNSNRRSAPVGAEEWITNASMATARNKHKTRLSTRDIRELQHHRYRYTGTRHGVPDNVGHRLYVMTRHGCCGTRFRFVGVHHR